MKLKWKMIFLLIVLPYSYFGANKSYAQDWVEYDDQNYLATGSSNVVSAILINADKSSKVKFRVKAGVTIEDVYFNAPGYSEAKLVQDLDRDPGPKDFDITGDFWSPSFELIKVPLKSNKSLSLSYVVKGTNAMRTVRVAVRRGTSLRTKFIEKDEAVGFSSVKIRHTVNESADQFYFDIPLVAGSKTVLIKGTTATIRVPISVSVVEGPFNILVLEEIHAYKYSANSENFLEEIMSNKSIVHDSTYNYYKANQTNSEFLDTQTGSSVLQGTTHIDTLGLENENGQKGGWVDSESACRVTINMVGSD